LRVVRLKIGISSWAVGRKRGRRRWIPSGTSVLLCNKCFRADKTSRHDYYQTATTVVASIFLKKIDKEKSTVDFQEKSIKLDLRTADSKRYETEFPLYASIKPGESKYRILGTKIEFTLVKADGYSWPVLRSDEKPTGEMIQVGQAGRV
jgi:hypothetical protein